MMQPRVFSAAAGAMVAFSQIHYPGRNSEPEISSFMFFKEVPEEQLRRELERGFRTGKYMGRYPDTGAKSEWFGDYNPDASGIFGLLTPKQKEILLESYRCGFFDHPRKINAGELAEKMGMHRTTLLEHIHKAEKRLMGHILEQVA